MNQTTHTHTTRPIKQNERQGRADEIPPALRLMLETVCRALAMIIAAIKKYLGRES